MIKRRKIPVLFLPNAFGAGEVTVTDDGRTIYFVSDKDVDMEELIFMYHIKKNQEDGQELNLGPLVNTPFKRSPRIYDDSILFSPQMVGQVMGRQIFLNVKLQMIVCQMFYTYLTL